MKKLYTLLLVVLITLSTTAQIVNIPDTRFKEKLLLASPSTNFQWASTQTPDINGNVTSYNKIDTNNDGQIQVSEALAIKYLKIYYEQYQFPNNLVYWPNFLIHYLLK